MRLWSISPAYLDKQGLCGLWRESLLAQSVLLKGEYTECPVCKGRGKFYDETPFNGRYSGVSNCWKCKCEGRIKTPYWGHPQLERFKANKDLSLYWITAYLYIVLDEGLKRDYKFDKSKIRLARNKIVTIPVTKGQLEYEFKHLCRKVMKRDRDWFIKIKGMEFRDNYHIKTHPLFKVIDGGTECWEKIKEKV
jgi:hypothetical protein